ncbi:MAG: sigma-70 family RNA polymerase sigma factor [Sedimentisphaerales bacterium]|nr:sigma-70 family RNA polymerase sigma factor [Sedimentisphaerales bacterium]
MKQGHQKTRQTLEKKISSLSLTAKEKALLAELMVEPIAFIPAEDFSRTTTMGPIMEQDIEVIQGVTLGSDEEQILFLQLNYARHRLCQIRRKLLRQKVWRKSMVQHLLNWYQKQLDLRSKIVTANMGLVLAMAQRVDYPGVEFTDLISEGSMALLRSTEKFDCSRGIKFSTYACRAIFKAFSRAAKRCYQYRSRYPAQLDMALEKSDYLSIKREEKHEDWVEEVRDIFDHNRADLSEIERSVVNMRFSLDDEERKPMTLKEVGAELGLTKERIRQIQNKALTKLRYATEERMAPA